MVFQIGLVPSRVDVITQIDGVEFQNAWKEHKTVEIENLQIPVIGKTQLLLIKNQPAERKTVTTHYGCRMNNKFFSDC